MMRQWWCNDTGCTGHWARPVFRWYLAIDQKPKVILAGMPGDIKKHSGVLWVGNPFIAGLTWENPIIKWIKWMIWGYNHFRTTPYEWSFCFMISWCKSLSLALFHLRPWNPRHVPRSQALHGGLGRWATRAPEPQLKWHFCCPMFGGAKWKKNKNPSTASTYESISISLSGSVSFHQSILVSQQIEDDCF